MLMWIFVAKIQLSEKITNIGLFLLCFLLFVTIIVFFVFLLASSFCFQFYTYNYLGFIHLGCPLCILLFSPHIATDNVMIMCIVYLEKNSILFCDFCLECCHEHISRVTYGISSLKQ